MEEKYVYVQAIKRGHEYRCVCVSLSNKSPVDSWVCARVCVCACVCNRSASENAIKEAPRDVCVCVCLCTRKIKDRHGYVYVCHHHSPVDCFLCVYVCSYVYANTAEWLWLHKAVILLLIMKYFVVCIKNSIVFPYNYTMQQSQ